MIKFIAHTWSSERDRNGNTYHAARVTRCADGSSIFIRDTGGPSNARGALWNAGLEPDEVYEVESVIPKRQFERMTSPAGYRPESDITKFARGVINGDR